MSNESEREYGWDDEIQNDGPEYVVLPDGDYNFKVTGFERGRYEGGEKIPACNMAIITLEIENDKGICFIQNRLFFIVVVRGCCVHFLLVLVRESMVKN